MAAVFATLRARAEPHVRPLLARAASHLCALVARAAPAIAWTRRHGRDGGAVAFWVLGLVLLAAAGGLL
jgi:hypothetical protein